MDSNKADKPAKTILLHERLAARPAHGVAPLRVSHPPAELAPGSVVGGYIIRERLGEGGMGVVYKAHDTNLDRAVALKVLPPHLFSNHQFLHRFRTEAQAQARLNSPNVVTLYSMLEIPAGLVLVMEYVEGETLLQRIRRQAPLPVDEAVRIFTQALQGVEHAHALGIVHRDLKPENIFITRQNEVKLMDFGVAKIVDHKDRTLAGSMLGTLLYISPEQVNGKEADFRSDIYTLGISLFEALTGRLPFERKTDYGLMHAHILEKPPSPRSLRRGLPEKLETIILKAIEKDPARRFQSAREFREALLKYRKHGLSSSTLTGRAEPADRRWGGRLLRRWRTQFAETSDSERHILGGFGFDAALFVMAGVLVYSLGFFPTAPGTGGAAEAESSDSVSQDIQDSPADSPSLLGPPAAAEKPAPARRPTTPAKKANKPNDPQSDAAGPSRNDRYDPLRRAWGG